MSARIALPPRTMSIHWNIYLDGQPVSGDVQLTAGSSHRLRFEFAQRITHTRCIEFTWVPPSDQLLAEAQSAMAQSDVTLLFLGLNSLLESEQSSLNLPGFLNAIAPTSRSPIPSSACCGPHWIRANR